MTNRVKTAFRIVRYPDGIYHLEFRDHCGEWKFYEVFKDIDDVNKRMDYEISRFPDVVREYIV